MEEKKLLHKLSLLERKELTISGAEKVISSNSSCITLKLNSTDLEIHGSDLSIESFVENNIVIKGNLDNIKYTKTSKQKDNLFKRIFK